MYLYVLLELESLSLLLGAIGLSMALTAVLYVTRNVDRYREEEQHVSASNEVVSKADL